MAIDLFSLRLNLETTGTAQAVGGLKEVEAQGARTASSMGGLNTANNSVKMGWMEQQSAIARLSTTQENLRNGVFRIQNDVKSASAAYKAGSISVDDYRTALTTANSHLIGLGNTSNLNEKQLKAYHSTLKDTAGGIKELDAVAAANMSTFDRMAAAASKFLVGFFAVKAVAGFLKDAALAAADADRSNVKLQLSVQAAGLSWAHYKDQLMDVSMATQRNTIFTDEAAKDALAKLILVTKDAAEAQRLLGIAQDLATFKQIGLVQATDTLVRVHAGYTRVVREFGITTKDGAQAVEQLGAMLSGQATQGAQTFQGRLMQLTNQWSEFKESIGNFLIASGLPEFLANTNRELATMSGWLGKFTTGGLKLGERDTADLNAELRRLRAGGMPSVTGAADPNSARAWLDRLTGNRTPSDANAQTQNKLQQIAIQEELVRREQQRALQEKIARGEQATADDKHIQELSDGLKLGVLTAAQDAERLRLLTALRADLKDTTDLTERIKLQGQINDLVGKQVAATEKLHRLELMMGNPAQAPDKLPGGTMATRTGKPGEFVNEAVRQQQEQAEFRKGLSGGNDLLSLIMRGQTPAGDLDQQTRERLEKLKAILTQGLQNLQSVGRGFTNLFRDIFSGKGIGESIHSMGKTVLGGLGSVFMQIAKKALAASPLFIALSKAMANPITAGFALAAFGIALTALGAAMGGAAHGDGGGGGGSSANADRITQVHLTADGAGGWMAPQTNQQPVIKVLGKDSPEGQRLFAEYGGKVSRRGF